MICGILLPVMGILSVPAPPFASVARLIDRGIRQGIYPGAVVVIGRRDTVLYARGFGRLTWAKGAKAPTPQGTRWDLASLTKVVATASAVMLLVDRGQVDLAAPVSRYLPRFTGGGRDRVTVRMLLDHSSGLRSYLALYRLAATPEAALDRLYGEPLTRPSGTSSAYSDLNAILLGLLVEAVSGERLDGFSRREIFAPLDMAATSFAPALPTNVSIAPSRRIGCCAVQGRVNDDNAFLLGGIAGHAGLFSTGDDLARFAQVWLRQGARPDGRGTWVSAATLQGFLLRSPEGGTRALGWDTPEHDGPHPSVYGTTACACAYGHTGWTGTMFWIDPERDLFLIFLTNRSLDPHIRNSIAALSALRNQLSDMVIRLVPRPAAPAPSGPPG